MNCKVLDLLALDSLLATIILNQHGLQQCYQMLLCGEVCYQTSASKIRQKKKTILSNSGCPWIPWTTDAWRLNPYSLQPKFISQSQIDPKYLKTLVLCWKNGWLMENHGLETYNDIMCADTSTGNTTNTPQFIWPICPNQPIIWDIFEKSSYHMSIVYGAYYSAL